MPTQSRDYSLLIARNALVEAQRSLEAYPFEHGHVRSSDMVRTLEGMINTLRGEVAAPASDSIAVYAFRVYKDGEDPRMHVVRATNEMKAYLFTHKRRKSRSELSEQVAAFAIDFPDSVWFPRSFTSADVETALDLSSYRFGRDTQGLVEAKLAALFPFSHFVNELSSTRFSDQNGAKFHVVEGWTVPEIEGTEYELFEDEDLEDEEYDDPRDEW